MKDEVQLLDIIEDKKNFYFFPRVLDAKKGIMDFYRVEKIEDLQPGSFGILEPKKICKKVSPSQIDIICTPGISIDPLGNRIGMGGGFYDRYFARCNDANNNPIKIGIIFSCQQSTENIPVDCFDIPVDFVITE